MKRERNSEREIERGERERETEAKRDGDNRASKRVYEKRGERKEKVQLEET